VGRPLEKGPIQRLEIGEIFLEYSLIDAIREGLPALLETVEMHDAYIVLEPGEPLPEEKQQTEKQAFKFPGLFPERLILKNINFQTVGEYGGFELKGLTFTLLPDEPGQLEVAKLDVPNLRTWNELSAKTSFDDRNLVLTDLSLSPEVHVSRLNLDASALEESELGVGLTATAFDSSIAVALHVSDLNASNDLTLEAKISDLSFDKVWDYLEMDGPVFGYLDHLSMRFTGKPEVPQSWNSEINLEVTDLSASGRDLGRIDGNVTIQEGSAEAAISSELSEGNTVDLKASAELPPTLEDFSEIDAVGELSADLATVGDVVDGAEGGANAKINFEIKDRQLTADLEADSDGVTVGTNSVSGLKATAHVEKNLQPEEDAPIFRDLLADIDLEVTDLTASGRDLGRIDGKVTVREGSAEAAISSKLSADNTVDFKASAELPPTLEDFSEIDAVGELTADLATVGDVVDDIEGGATAKVDFEIKDGKLTADLKADSESVTVGTNSVSGLKATAHVEKDLRSEDGAPIFRDLAAKIDASAASVTTGGVTVDNLKVDTTVDGANVSVNDASLTRGQNKFNVTANYVLPEDMKSFQEQPLDADVQMDAPNLEDFVAENSPIDLGGSLKIEGKVDSKGGLTNGKFDIVGDDLTVEGLDVASIRGDLTIRDNQAQLGDLNVVLDGDNRLVANGTVGIAEPYAYDASLEVTLNDLSVLDPLAPEPVGGALALTWSGKGNVSANEHSGNVDLDLTNGRYGERDQLAATIEGQYNWPESIEIPVFRASAKEGDVSLSLAHAQDRLNVTDLVARLGELTVLTGSLSIPLHADHPDDLELLIPNDEPLSANLQTGTLRLREVSAALPLEETPPVTGTASLSLTASGSLDQLVAAVEVRANDLRSDAVDVQPANVSLDVRLANDTATLDGRITQPLVQPITVTGNLPIDVVQIRRDGEIPASTPLAIDVDMSRSSLGFIPSLVPTVRFIEGTAAIDLAIRGTIEQPTIEGDVEADVAGVRLTMDGFPPISDITVRISSNTERLTIDALRGDLGGGTFGAEGSVTFGGVEQPIFDLRFGTLDALVLQDEAITARINSRIALTGPLDAANVTGEIYVTKSRFYKDIDILPIGLPGRPAPDPPPAPTVKGVTDPPLSNWTFDVAVRTADPFLIQGNLANGRAIFDLRLTGTGAAPTMEGEVRIQNLVTSLPFSELEISNGLVFFQRDKPFVANFDIRGTSQIRNYDITAYVYGDQNDPQVRFTSQPPLPQTEIVSLIATGVTSEDIADNPSVLAGRAGVLLFQKLSRRFFPPKDPADRKKTVLSDVDISLGEIDSKTGQQSVVVRYPLTENFVLIGGVDVRGDFRGQVKYLIRFK
ncbi:MAG: translocation/assembly module TamB domain-containing protein, partial [Chthoniobacterales bacterium]